jgi:hypothetical protein
MQYIPLSNSQQRSIQSSLSTFSLLNYVAYSDSTNIDLADHTICYTFLSAILSIYQIITACLKKLFVMMLLTLIRKSRQASILTELHHFEPARSYLHKCKPCSHTIFQRMYAVYDSFCCHTFMAFHSTIHSVLLPVRILMLQHKINI